MTEIGTETRKTVRNLVSLPSWYHYPVRDPTGCHYRQAY
jgi:hypothetical protein